MSQIKSGAVLSYLGLFITIIIALVYTPIMIRLLGQAEYGLYALVGSFAAYFSIMDMGLGNAVVRYVSKNRAAGDKESEAKLNGMFMIMFSVIGLLVVAVGLLLFYRVESIFGASLTVLELEKAEIMILILIFNFAVSFPLAVFGAIMQAYEKFVVVKTVSIARSVLVPLITLPFLFMGFGSVAMIVVMTVVNVSLHLFNVVYSFKKLDISFHFGKMDTGLLKEILGYSFFVFLGVIVDQIYWNTDQFILGVIAGTIPVAVYAIAMQFITLYIRFSTSISGLFLPKVSMMIANNASNDKLTDLMIRFGRVQFIVIALILSGFILFGQPFINLWAGLNYSEAYIIVVVIMVPLSIPLIQNLGISILYAKNLQKFRSVNLIFIALLNVAITIPLVQNFGGLGAAIATAASLSIGNILIMNLYYHFKIGIDIPLFWKNILLMSIPVIASLLVGVGMNWMVPSENIGAMLIKILVFMLVFMTFMWNFGLNKYEKDLFTGVAQKMKKLLEKIFKKFAPN